MQFEDIVQKVLSYRPDLTREEILRKIKDKEKAAKGFLTRESAARLVAAELGVEPSEVSFKRRVSIRDLISGLGDVTVMGRVILVSSIQMFLRSDGTEGKVRRLLVADETGEAKIVLWNGKADTPNIASLTGRVVRFSHGYVRRGFGGAVELNIGLKGIVEVMPPTELEDEFPPLTRFVKKIGELTGKENTANVLGIVRRIYPLSTFSREDGSEGKVRRLELEGGGGKVTIVLWNNKVDELAKVEVGRYLELLGAKVRETPDGSYELSVGSSTDAVLLAEIPPGLEG